MKIFKFIFNFAIISSLPALCFLSFPSLSYAQTEGPYPHTVPQKPKPLSPSGKVTVKPLKKNKPVEKTSNAVIIPSLKGIAFVSYKSFDKNGVSPSILNKGLYLKSFPVLNDSSFINPLSGFLFKPLTLKGLKSIISLTRYVYSKNNISFMDVTAPPQNVSNGILQIVIIKYKVNRINVTGNKYFSSSYIKYESGIRKGQTPSKKGLLSSINWLNQNPFMRSDAVLSPGKTPGSIDIDLLTKDVIPFRVYAGFDNQGIPSLGMNEWNAGFNWGNVFGQGQMLSYQIAQSFNTRYRSNALSYDIPFPWQGRLELLASYSTASPSINRYFSELGRNAQVSIYYKQNLNTFNIGTLSLGQSVGIGYDFKTTNNNLAFESIQVFNGVAQIDQFPLFYRLTEHDPYGYTSLNNRLVISPGDMNADNSTSSFNTIYAGTRSDYIYDNISLLRHEDLPSGTAFVSSLIYQTANHNLLYSEQLSAGGIYSSPGYAADAISGSKGVMLNEEFKLPRFNFSGSVTRLSLFWDYADLSSVSNVSDYTGLPSTAVIASTGVKLHADISKYLDLRFALGWRLRHMPYGSYGKGLFEDIVVTVGF